jgi:hypothetical protein
MLQAQRTTCRFTGKSAALLGDLAPVAGGFRMG